MDFSYQPQKIEKEKPLFAKNVFIKKQYNNKIEFQPVNFQLKSKSTKGLSEKENIQYHHTNNQDYLQTQENLETICSQHNILEKLTDPNLPFEVLVDILYQKYYQQGIHDFIVNSIYVMSDAKIEFFICDLIFWVIVRESEPLEQFLVHRCANSIKMFFLIHWQLVSFSEVLQVNQKLEQHQERIDKLLHKIEQSMVNGSRQQVLREKQLSTQLQQNVNQINQQQEEEYTQKELELSNIQRQKNLRSQYCEKVNTFIVNLVDISLHLKAMTKPERKTMLTDYIYKSNRYIQYLRHTYNNSELYNGITIPFARQYGEDFSSTLIISLVPKQFICFETRKRVPYRIVVETIDPNDLKVYKPRKALKKKESIISQEEAQQYEKPDLISKNNEDGENEISPQNLQELQNMNDPDNMKQNKYKDLQYLTDLMQKDNPDQEAPQIQTFQHGGRQSLLFQKQQSNIQNSKVSLNSIVDSETEAQNRRHSALNKVNNFLESQDKTPRNQNLQNTNIASFHREFLRKKTLSPDYDNFRVANLLKNDKQLQQIHQDRIEEQSESFASSQCSFQSPLLKDKKLKFQNATNNNFSKKQLIQDYSFGNLPVIQQEQEDYLQKQKQKIVLQNNLTIDRQQQFDKNIVRFNIMFKKQTYMKNQIQRRFSFSDTSMKKVQQRKKDFQQYFDQYLQKNLPRKLNTKDLKISQVLQFFKQIMKQYPAKITYIDNIYRYLHYDIIEQKLRDLGKESLLEGEEGHQFNQEFPRKFGPWGEIWSDRMSIIKQESPYGHLPSYKIRSIIIKGGDDLRQELVCMQLIYKIDTIFKNSKLDLWLWPYEIIVTSSSSGIIEFLPNTQSIDGLKKQNPGKNLAEIYFEQFGEKRMKNEVQMNFVRSFAAYSIISFILQVKDRHNGNILIDSDGHLVHIDFGFIFSISPGNLNFESAPFKFTKEYGEIMGGQKSVFFEKYKELVYLGFDELRKEENLNTLCNIIEIMGEESDLPCYTNFDIVQFRNQFKEFLPADKFKQYVEGLIKQSYDSMRTVAYDWFQKKTNGILP